jgi:cyclopropane fatty-acyl-phospholipid synthase-like methyltransferase
VSIREREKEYILENISHDKPKVILDVGCCGSLLPEELSKKDHKVFGLDVQNYAKPKGFTFINTDIISSDFSFEKEMFDYIICLSTIEHIGLGYYGDKVDRQGDRIVLEKCSLFLKNEGRLLLTLPFAGNYNQNRFQRIHTKKSFLELIDKLFEIEKEQFWIPLAKRKWIPASEKDAENVHSAYPESNNACFVLKKADI